MARLSIQSWPQKEHFIIVPSASNRAVGKSYRVVQEGQRMIMYAVAD
jgi:hypothetical protein